MASSATFIEPEGNRRLLNIQNRLKTAFKYLLLYIIYLTIAVVVAIVYTGSVRFQNYVKTINLNISPIKITDVDLEDFKFKHTTSRTYPFLGALIKNKPYKFLCTAVIINAQYLISDAKCFSENAIDIHVRVGSDFWNVFGSTYSIETFSIINNNASNSHSVALILINATIELSTVVQPANIDWTPSVIDEKGVIVGWLPFHYTLWENSSQMIDIEISIWKNSRCKMYHDTDYTCGTINNHKCNIVPSGPLVLERNIIGLWYNETPCVKNPLIFYNLNYIKKWLDNFQIKYNINP